ncbi:MAG: carbohydrate kinase [Thalassovita sp.]
MILCCGEALIDMIPETDSAGQTKYTPHTGGAVFNTAIGLGRLGASVGLLTGISTDGFGQQLEAALTASKVDTGFLIHSDQPSTLAFVHLTDGQAKYSFYDEKSASQAISPDQLPKLPEEVGLLFFGGISLCNAPAADVYASLCKREAGQRLIMIDPNIRPGFAHDESSYRTRMDQMLSQADIVKISDEDLEWLRPGPADLMQKVQDLLASGPSLVLLTRGGDGATGVTRAGLTVSAPVNKVNVVDTVGAGDTFNAGVLSKLEALDLADRAALGAITEEQLANVLQYGAKVAAVTVSRAGANPPWASEL